MLKVWLPLRGDLENKGVSGVTVTNSGATVNSAGKIGSCYSFNGSNNWLKLEPALLSNSTQEFSVACWYKTNSTTNSGCLFAQRNGANANGISIFVYGTTGHILLDDGARWDITPQALTANTWYHLAFTRSEKGKAYYINGQLVASTTTVGTPSTASSTNFMAIGSAHNSATTVSGNCFNGYLNDWRLYDHCLSPLEVKEISQGLILHYKLNGVSGGVGENLLLGSEMKAAPIQQGTNYTASPFRYYNAGASLHTRTNIGGDVYEDTILLNSTANLGIAFERLATDMNLDSNSQYTLSCWAKTTQPNASLAIGLSYFKTDDTAVWRGGTNKKAFAALDTWQFFTLTFKPDADTKAICYCFTVNGVANGTNTWTIKYPKLEKGAVATGWMPAPEDMGIDKTKVVDASGYGNDGTITGIISQEASDRYQVGTYSSSGTDSRITTPSLVFNPDAVTMSIWFKSSNTAPTGNYHMIVDSNAHRQWYEMCVHNTGYFRAGLMVNGTRYANNGTTKTLLNGNWHMLSVTYDGATIKRYVDGVSESSTTIAKTSGLSSPTAITLFRDGPSASYACKETTLADFRIYATALSDSDILTLYHTPAQIDNLGGLHGFEMVEDGGNSIAKNGLTHTGNLNQFSQLSILKYDPNIYFEPDGSAWVHIFHHNNPSTGAFGAQTYANSVYLDADKWYNATEVCNKLNKWEFLVKYAFTAGGTAYKERWIQTKNPETAVFADVAAANITRVTGNGYKTGTWGGLYKLNNGGYWVMNNGTNGNTWGSTPRITIYQGGTPGYGGTVTTTGYNDLYVRIDNVTLSDVSNAKITSGNLYQAKNFIEK